MHACCCRPSAGVLQPGKLAVERTARNLPASSCQFPAAPLVLLCCAGGEQPEHDPHRGPLSHPAQLPRCGPLPGGVGCGCVAAARVLAAAWVAAAVVLAAVSAAPAPYSYSSHPHQHQHQHPHPHPPRAPRSLPPPAGLFYFDASYRPVPLEMQFVGVSERNVMARLGIQDEVCYQKVAGSLKKGFQAMVFVHRWVGAANTQTSGTHNLPATATNKRSKFATRLFDTTTLKKCVAPAAARTRARRPACWR